MGYWSDLASKRAGSGAYGAAKKAAKQAAAIPPSTPPGPPVANNSWSGQPGLANISQFLPGYQPLEQAPASAPPQELPPVESNWLNIGAANQSWQNWLPRAEAGAQVGSTEENWSSSEPGFDITNPSSWLPAAQQFVDNVGDTAGWYAEGAKQLLTDPGSVLGAAGESWQRAAGPEGDWGQAIVRQGGKYLGVLDDDYQPRPDMTGGKVMGRLLPEAASWWAEGPGKAIDERGLEGAFETYVNYFSPASGAIGVREAISNAWAGAQESGAQGVLDAAGEALEYPLAMAATPSRLTGKVLETAGLNSPLALTQGITGADVPKMLLATGRDPGARLTSVGPLGLATAGKMKRALDAGASPAEVQEQIWEKQPGHWLETAQLLATDPLNIVPGPAVGKVAGKVLKPVLDKLVTPLMKSTRFSDDAFRQLVGELSARVDESGRIRPGDIVDSFAEMRARGEGEAGQLLRSMPGLESRLQYVDTPLPEPVLGAIQRRFGEAVAKSGYADEVRTWLGRTRPELTGAALDAEVVRLTQEAGARFIRTVVTQEKVRRLADEATNLLTQRYNRQIGYNPLKNGNPLQRVNEFLKREFLAPFWLSVRPQYHVNNMLTNTLTALQGGHGNILQPLKSVERELLRAGWFKTRYTGHGLVAEVGKGPALYRAPVVGKVFKSGAELANATENAARLRVYYDQAVKSYRPAWQRVVLNEPRLAGLEDLRALLFDAFDQNDIKRAFARFRVASGNGATDPLAFSPDARSSWEGLSEDVRAIIRPYLEAVRPGATADEWGRAVDEALAALDSRDGAVRESSVYRTMEDLNSRTLQRLDSRPSATQGYVRRLELRLAASLYTNSEPQLRYVQGLRKNWAKTGAPGLWKKRGIAQISQLTPEQSDAYARWLTERIEARGLTVPERGAGADVDALIAGLVADKKRIVTKLALGGYAPGRELDEALEALDKIDYDIWLLSDGQQAILLEPNGNLAVLRSAPGPHPDLVDVERYRTDPVYRQAAIEGFARALGLDERGQQLRELERAQEVLEALRLDYPTRLAAATGAEARRVRGADRLRDDLLRAQRDVISESAKAADAEATRTFRDYRMRNKLDQLLDSAVPFHYWFVRNSLFQIEYAFEHPGQAWNALRALRALEDSTADLPSSFRYSLLLATLPDGGQVRIKPLSSLFPFGSQGVELVNPMLPTDAEKAGPLALLQEGNVAGLANWLSDKLQAVGLRVGPQIEIPVRLAQRFVEAANLPGKDAVQALFGPQAEQVTALIPQADLLRAMAAALELPQGDPLEQIIYGTDISSYQDWLIKMRLAARVGEGAITQEQAAEAFSDSEGELYQDTLREVLAAGGPWSLARYSGAAVSPFTADRQEVERLRAEWAKLPRYSEARRRFKAENPELVTIQHLYDSPDEAAAWLDEEQFYSALDALDAEEQQQLAGRYPWDTNRRELEFAYADKRAKLWEEQGQAATSDEELEVKNLTKEERRAKAELENRRALMDKAPRFDSFATPEEYSAAEDKYLAGLSEKDRDIYFAEKHKRDVERGDWLAVAWDLKRDKMNKGYARLDELKGVRNWQVAEEKGEIFRANGPERAIDSLGPILRIFPDADREQVAASLQSLMLPGMDAVREFRKPGESDADYQARLVKVRAQSEYYSLGTVEQRALAMQYTATPKSERKAFRAKYPQLDAYWDLVDEWEAANPEKFALVSEDWEQRPDDQVTYAVSRGGSERTYGNRSYALYPRRSRSAGYQSGGARRSSFSLSSTGSPESRFWDLWYGLDKSVKAAARKDPLVLAVLDKNSRAGISDNGWQNALVRLDEIKLLGEINSVDAAGGVASGNVAGGSYSPEKGLARATFLDLWDSLPANVKKLLREDKLVANALLRSSYYVLGPGDYSDLVNYLLEKVKGIKPEDLAAVESRPYPRKSYPAKKKALPPEISGVFNDYNNYWPRSARWFAFH